MTPVPKTLTTDESERLLKHLLSHRVGLSPRPKDWRNHTMALLMLDAGLRVGEVVKLLQLDLLFDAEPVTSLVVPAAITKTRLQRIVPLTPRLRDAIKDMHEHWWSKGGLDRACYAFYKVYSDESLTTRQVERIIRTAAIIAIGRPVNPHVLRHTFASRLMRVTNARTVQQLLGHKQLSSTQIYTHPNAEDLKTAIAKISDPNSPNSSDIHTKTNCG
ncbi:tyrosine-type recombinase/integrase [Candidatus Pacearchaeota archaeon]|nr:tyrosine-type recombinase/integrase [Candidatus Pacearchaeota archaeon]